MSVAVRASRIVVVVVAVLAAVLLAAVGPMPPHAAAQDGEPSPIEVGLRAIDAVLDPDDADGQVTATLHLEAGDRDRRDLRLVTTVFGRVDDRAGLRAVDAGDLPTVFAAVSTSLGDLPAGTSRVVGAAAPRADLSLSSTARGAVHPLRYEVFEGDDPVGSIMTSVVVLPADGPAPLRSTTVVQAADPSVRPAEGGPIHPDVEAVVDPGGVLRRLAGDLADMREGGVSPSGVALVVDGRLLIDLERMATGFERPDGTVVSADDRVARRAATILAELRRLADRNDTEVLALPYASADLVALVGAGQGPEAVRLLEEGAVRTAAALGADVTRGVVVPPDGLDQATLAAIGPAQADAVLLGERYLSFADEGGMEPVRRLRTADGGEVRMLVPDLDLALLFEDPRSIGVPAVVQALRAETALQWLAEDRDDSDAALMRIDLLRSAPGLLPAVADAVATAPWLRPVGISALAATTRPSPRVVRLAYPPQSAASQLDATYVERLGQAYDALGPMEALLAEDDPAAAGYAESLLVASSAAYRDPALRPAGEARVDEVLGRLDLLVDSVQVAPSAPVTLTSTTGEVPVTLTNTGPDPVRVRTTLESTRFDFPAGAMREITLPAQSSTQLRFLTEALNPGGFAAITVTVDDPTGTTVLTQTRLSVRSTAFPVVGLVATIGSGIVLAVWGIKQSLRRRRAGAHDEPSQIDVVA